MNWCHGVCQGYGRYECTECKLWSQKHGSLDIPGGYFGCASSACNAAHDAVMRGHPSHRWKELYPTVTREAYWAAVGRPEDVKRKEDEEMLRAWRLRRERPRTTSPTKGGA